MRKTTLYLSDELKTSIERLAEDEGLSEAEVIRGALRDAVARATRPRPRIPLVATGLGDPTIAARADELLDGFGR
jgi:Arc/MetJ-type ribon-helix-helix transcriptional regulator